MPTDQSIILTLAGVVTSLAGFISFLYRDSLKRSDERITKMEEREDDLLKTQAATITQIAANQTAMFEAVKTISQIVQEQQLRAKILEEQRLQQLQQARGMHP